MKLRLFVLPLITAGALVTTNIAISDSTPNTPNYDVIPEAGDTPLDGYCLVTFDASEDSSFTASGARYQRFQVRRGHTWGLIKDKQGVPKEDGTDLADPADPNLVFKTWYTEDHKRLSDNYVFDTSSCVITARFDKVYTPSEFVIDEWPALIELAQSGYDALIQKYHPYGDTFVLTDDVGDDPAQKTRYVQIKGLINPADNTDKWPVRVIGENHDLINGETNKVAALTFEFVNPINNAIGWDYSSEPGHQDWEHSSLRQYLNNEILPQIENGLAIDIQYVNKKTDNGFARNEIKDTKEQLFIPAADEVFDFNNEATGYEKQNLSDRENSLYDYYKIHQDASAGTIDTDYFIKKTAGDGQPISVWLRSPNTSADYVSSSSQLAYIADNADWGGLLHLTGAKNALGVCPCFAIGEQEVHSINFRSASDGRVKLQSINDFANNKIGYTGYITPNIDSDYEIPSSTQGGIILNEGGVETVLTEWNTKDDEPANWDYRYNPDNGKLEVKSDVFGNGGGELVIRAALRLNKFKSATWEELIAVANQGLETLQDEYGYDSFVGKTKYLTIGTKRYETRVIGQNHDVLASGGKAPLTFEFFTPIIDTPIAYGENNHDYTKSNLNSLLKLEADKLPQGIATVEKEVGCYNEALGKWEDSPKIYETSLFALTESETVGGSVDHFPEGSMYEYYSQGFSKVKYLDIDQKTPISYWLRTPNIDPEKPNLINAAGTDGYASDVNPTINDIYYAAPSFAIGKDVDTSTITFSGSNYTIQGLEPEPIHAVPQDKPCSIKQIKAKTIGGLTPIITSDNVTITTADGNIFTDWSLADAGGGAYNIDINRVPLQDFNVAISINYDFVSFISSADRPVKVFFTKDSGAPDVELAFSRDGNSFDAYDMGTEITLNKGESLYFKAKEGANNTHFAEIPSADEFSENDIRGVHFMTDYDSTSLYPETALTVSGNIMSLLGDGTTIPTTINASGAFAKLFNRTSGLGDASGLILPATGVDTLQEPAEVKGAYAYMFNSCSDLTSAPSKVAGFNNYNENVTNVSHTYYEMFASTCLKNIPYCDLSKVSDYMCYRMFSMVYSMSVTTITTANNFSADSFKEYAPHSYEYMFDQCGHLEYGPSTIGTLSSAAAPCCCKNMFEGDYRLKQTPIISCSVCDDQSFYGCFSKCSTLQTATINFTGFVAGSAGGFEECFNMGESIYDETVCPLTSLTIGNYDLGGTTRWPDLAYFRNWLFAEKYLPGTLFCTEHTKKKLEDVTPGPSSVPPEWSIVAI